MGKNLSVITENRTITLPDNTLCFGYELYHSSNIDIMLTNEPIEACSFEHAHEGYEFFIPLAFSPQAASLTIENINIKPLPGYLIPANPDQAHGIEGNLTINKSICIYVQKEYLQHIASETAGIERVHFYAEPNSYNPNLQYFVDLFVREARNRQNGYRHILESISMQIVIDLLRNTKNNAKGVMNLKDVGAKENILRAIDYLKENYNQKLSNAELLSIANLSPYYFIRLFKKETGKTPHEYLVHLKIEKAKEFLAYSNCSVTEICFLCGFTEHSHFSKVFKRLTGCTPLNYRRDRKALIR